MCWILVQRRKVKVLVGAFGKSCKLGQIRDSAMVGSGIYDLETQANGGLEDRANTKVRTIALEMVSS